MKILIKILIQIYTIFYDISRYTKETEIMSDKFLDKVRALILAIGSLFMLICIQLAGLYTFMIVCRLVLGRSVSLNEEPVFAAVFHIIYAIVAALIFGLLRKSYMSLGKERKGFDDSAELNNVPVSLVTYVLRLIILGIGIQAFAYGVLNIVYEFAADTAVMQSYKSTINNLNGSTTYLIFVYTMFLAPLAEELVFRGVIFDAANSGFSFLGANLIQAACFGLYHGNIVQFVYAFIIGLMFGYVRNRSGRLAEVIGVHMTVNISGIFIVPIISYAITTLTGNGLATFIVIGICGLAIIIENIKHSCYNRNNAG